MFQPDSSLKTNLTGISLAARQLTVYRSLSGDSVFKLFVNLIDLLIAPNKNPNSLVNSYFDLIHNILNIPVPPGFKGNTWQYHLINLLLSDDNPFSRECEISDADEIDDGLKRAAERDIAILCRMASIESKTLSDELRNQLSELMPEITKMPVLKSIPGWDEKIHTKLLSKQDTSFLQLANLLAESIDWHTKLAEIAKFYRLNGTGIFGRYTAFRWIRRENIGYLEGIEQPDPVTFNSLFGYDNQRKIIIDNTDNFLKNLPANNVLLYGERGTGKSSTVKALLNKFASRGLRLVELAKQDLSDFPALIRLLRNRAQKFIIFIDDLSFEENEPEFSHLKGILEGTIEAKPDNILIYATSNRRHLITERFSDRSNINVQDEIRLQDTVQEKLSLADRFGITITFTSPSQAEYLAIVEGLVDRAGLSIEKEELHRLALQWELRYNGRSGRTARQFVDWLIGEKMSLLYRKG